jgi:hypothetical protein
MFICEWRPDVRIKEKLTNRRRGQSLMEFALVTVIFLNLLVVTYNAVLAFGVQQYLSYAAFMSARALQASSSQPDQGNNSQTARATAVLKKFVPSAYLKLPGFSRNLAHILKTHVPTASAVPYGMKGPTADREVFIQFEVPLLTMPGLSLGGQFTSLTLEAKSYLGREPTRSECMNFFKVFYNYFLPAGISTRSDPQVQSGWTGMDDNDC